MKKLFCLILLFVSIFPIISVSQNATLRGVILDEANIPISNVNIKTDDSGTVTNENGFYLLKISVNKDVTVEFSHLSHKKVVATFNLKNGEELEFNPVMDVKIEQIATVVIKGNRRKEVEGIITIKPEQIRKYLVQIQE